jgi:uncharacterized repeat protein (TIGR01451 family)
MKFRMSLAVAALALAALASTSAALAAGGGTGANLQISGSASTGSPNAGAAFSYTFSVKNSGPEAANAATFSDTLPAGVGLNAATVNGSATACTIVDGTVSCALGTLANGGQATIVVNANAPWPAGTYSNTASTTSDTADPNTTNNSVTVTMQVKATSGKAACVPLSSDTATSGYIPGAMVLTASYSLDPCISRGTVTITMTNTATGWVEYQLTDPGQDLATGLFTTTYTLPAFATTYRVDFTVTDKRNGTLFQRAAALTTTPLATTNCATITKNNLTAGYWLTYAAIWESFTATDCGYGRERVEIRITNVATGAVVYDYASWPLDGLLDYEGAVVQYSTEYQFDVEVRGALGELLDAQSQRIVSAPRP